VQTFDFWSINPWDFPEEWQWYKEKKPLDYRGWKAVILPAGVTEGDNKPNLFC